MLRDDAARRRVVAVMTFPESCRRTVFACVWAALALALLRARAEVLQATGFADPRLASLDAAMSAFVRTNDIPRAQLAVAFHGTVVFNRAYTWMPDGAVPTDPTNCFRIASVTKPMTAIAVMRLVESGKVGLDRRIAEWIDVAGAKDPRWTNITVRHLLNHRGGWDRGASGDLMFRDADIAARAGRALPVERGDVIEFAKTQPLDFEPGTRYVYSNFGYLLLGRIIGKASGKSYPVFVKEKVFDRVGASGMHVGRSLAAHRIPGEVEYSQPDLPDEASVFGGGKVPVVQGGFNLENMDAHGGIVCPAEALVRVVSAFDDPSRSPLLSEAGIASMWGRPPGGDPKAASYYAAGWLVRPVGEGRVNAWHDGSLPGTRAYLVRLADGIMWAALLNRREKPGQPDFGGALDAGVNRETAVLVR